MTADEKVERFIELIADGSAYGLYDADAAECHALEDEIRTAMREFEAALCR